MEKLVTYVEFEYPGSFFAETEVKAITKRDVRKAKANKYAFAFRFFDIIEKEVTVGGEVKRVVSSRRNVSPTYYPGAKILDAKAVAKLPGDHGILLSNMRCNGWEKVVRTRRGNFQPFEKNCEVA